MVLNSGIADSERVKETRTTGSQIERLRRLKESACHHSEGRARHGVPSGSEINGRASFLQLLKCVSPVVPANSQERSRQDIVSLNLPRIARRAMTKLLQFLGPIGRSIKHKVGQ